MAPFSYWLKLWLIHASILLLASVRQSWIPRTNPCDVTVKNNSIVFHCGKRSLKEIPDGITSNATELELQENKITNISKDAFRGLSELTILNLNWVNKYGKVFITEDNIYDAFVTFDTKDPLVSDWVHNQLRVQLEECGETVLPICLEERDWTPGTPFIDSLSHSIRQSRKTIFVLTEAYVQSGIFKMAAYLAHQRLLDENMDVIVLLLLEPVLQHSQFLRLRRRLCGHSVLEWPKNPLAEHWFWQSLRNAIIMDNQAMYNKLYTRYFTTM
ncbi:toll-like receptor 7-like [Arapaima gigas]